MESHKKCQLILNEAWNLYEAQGVWAQDRGGGVSMVGILGVKCVLWVSPGAAHAPWCLCQQGLARLWKAPTYFVTQSGVEWACSMFSWSHNVESTRDLSLSPTGVSTSGSRPSPGEMEMVSTPSSNLFRPAVKTSEKNLDLRPGSAAWCCHPVCGPEKHVCHWVHLFLSHTVAVIWILHLFDCGKRWLH